VKIPIGPPLRVALLPDFAEEGWPSMDLCAEMIYRHLAASTDGKITPYLFEPHYRRRLTRIPYFGRHPAARNADRLLNRFWDYPRALQRQRVGFDFFLLCDHSYSQLLHVLPPKRAGIFCHDLDAFRSVIEPEREPRPRWYRAMMARVLAGLRKAVVIFYSTQTIRAEIERHGLIEPERLVHAPHGASLEFTAEAIEAETPLSILPNTAFLLHVGSCIPRKRIDVLLETFAMARLHTPDLRLLQIGGEWTASQQSMIDRLGIRPWLSQVRGITRAQLAACYRRAQLVLLPSEAEGFGLPLIEALACGAPVMASDLKVLREVGGSAAYYIPVGDLAAWKEQVSFAIRDPTHLPSRQNRLAHAKLFSWSAQAATIGSTYLRLAAGLVPRVS